MSFPVARPDRRILARTRIARACIVHFGGTQTMRGTVRELDALGARLRLEADCPEISGDLTIVMEDGARLHAAAAWRIGDVIGVRRRPNGLKGRTAQTTEAP